MHLGSIEASGLTKPRLGRHGKAPSPWGEGWGEGVKAWVESYYLENGRFVPSFPRSSLGTREF
jgi:hypothetical protein